MRCWRKLGTSCSVVAQGCWIVWRFCVLIRCLKKKKKLSYCPVACLRVVPRSAQPTSPDLVVSFTPGTGVGLKAPSLRASLYRSRVSPRSAPCWASPATLPLLASISLQAVSFLGLSFQAASVLVRHVCIQCTNWCLRPASTRWYHDPQQRCTSDRCKLQRVSCY